MRSPLPRLLFLRCLLGLSCVSAPLSSRAAGETEAPAKAAPRPGSVDLPIKALETPLPPLPAGEKRVNPIRLGVWVKADGTVDSIEVLNNNPKWRDAALKAVQAWKFEPIEWEGKRIPARTEVILTQFAKGVSFTQSSIPNYPDEVHAEGEFGLTLPMVTYDPDIFVPILERANRGKLEAGFEFVVETDGRPSQLTVLGANSESAYRAVINQVANLVYKPGTVRGEPVRVKLKQVTSLASMEQPPEALAGLVEAMDPVYPYAQLLAGTGGVAKVKFTLNAEGAVSGAEVVEATHPDFGYALKAAVESWLFSPSAAAQKPEREYEHEFNAASLPGGVERLVAQLRKGETISGKGEGLNGRPRRAYSPPLAYPPEMLKKMQAGSAVIEFVIDRGGLVQIPKIVSASDPIFGWAAATWIGSMRFAPLLRNGVPTDLRLSVPVEFTPPQEEKKREEGS